MWQSLSAMNDAVDIIKVDNGDSIYWEGFMSPVVDDVTEEVNMDILEFCSPMEETSGFTPSELLYAEDVSSLETHILLSLRGIRWTPSTDTFIFLTT